MADAILAGKPLASYPNGLPLLIAFWELIFPNNLVPLILVTMNLAFQLLMLIFLEEDIS